MILERHPQTSRNPLVVQLTQIIVPPPEIMEADRYHIHCKKLQLKNRNEHMH